MIGRLRILLIDDNEHDRALAAMVLRRHLGEPEVIEIGTAIGFAPELSAGAADVAVADNRLSWAKGADVLRAIKRRHPDCVTILFDAADTITAPGFEFDLDATLRKQSAGYLELPRVVRNGVEKVQARRQRIRDEAPFAGRLDQIPLGYFRVSRDGRLLAWNAATARLLGAANPGDLRDKHLPGLIAGAPAQARCSSSLSAGVVESFVEVEIRRLDGSSTWVSLSFWPLEDDAPPTDRDTSAVRAGGELGHCEGVLWDIASYKETETELAQLRSKYGPVLDAGQRVRSDPLLRLVQAKQERDPADTGTFAGVRPESLAAAAARSAESAPSEEADRVVEGMQTPPAPALVPVNIETAVLEAMRGLQQEIRESNARIRAGALPTLRLERESIVSLLRHLLQNAIKFRGETSPRITVRAEHHGQHWLLYVRDNGVGIPRDALEGIFEHSAGLRECRRIAATYGGQIWADSEPGAGATFYVTLKVEAVETQKVELAVRYNGKDMGRVSVVDISNKREITRAALALPRLHQKMGERTIKDVHVVGKKVVNIIT